MRTSILAIVLALFSCTAIADDSIVCDMRVASKDADYRVTVSLDELGSTLEITLVDDSGERVSSIAKHRSEHGFISARPIDMSHLVANWECGTGICTTIFRLASTPQKPVFDQWSEWVPDFVSTSTGTIMLFYTGKHYLGRTGLTWVPERAMLYRWTGDKYQRIRTVRYPDRFLALAAINAPRAKTATR